ncbi:hypothetical protein Q428_05270 [Fervidicella metallireducens AeB]|uniref:Cardiolipin synthase N-terminal domain-containing protein n=1 Tax=Fervidicella metallireducens AeB TaxID=1403537 RepID=A0A017RVW5_9CLOT|nr:PLD nuclease N-terminal domain-containing protein [Fervidicella metallireducens]EYE88918.1 hypothetical protein Q428_05270 [Fervidicella metallireducens AeB]
MLEGMSNIEILKLFAPVIGMQIILMVFCLIKLRNDRVKWFPKWLWAVLIISTGLLGPIVYLLFGRERD